MGNILSAVGFGVVQFWTVLIMIWAVFPRKVSLRRELGLMALFLVLFGVLDGVIIAAAEGGVISSRTNFLLFLLLVVGGASLYGWQTLRVDPRQLLSTVLFFHSFLLAALAVMETVVEQLGGPAVVGSGGAVTLLLLLTPLLRKMTKPVTVHLSQVYWVLMNVAPVMLMVLVTLWAGVRQGDNFLFMGVCLFVMDLTIYCLHVRMIAEMEEQIGLELTNQNLSFQIRQMDNVQVMLENTRQMRHEQKSHYFLIESLIREGKNEEALDYIHQVIEPAFAKAELVSTGNHFVDMVLSQKVAEARQRSIPVALNVLLPPKLEMNQQMLCSLLFNLWDNALEASAKVAQPDIRFSMREDGGYLKISIRNRVEGSVLQQNPNLRTTKQDARSHGIGMSMIRSVVSQYNGHMKLTEEEGYFVVTLMLAVDAA